MDNELLKIRMDLLFDCLVFCTDCKKTFTTGERIMINQERGRCLYLLTYPLEDYWQVSPEIEAKITEVKRLQKVYRFNNIKIDPLNDEY
jgi:hypothetical protein